MGWKTRKKGSKKQKGKPFRVKPRRSGKRLEDRIGRALENKGYTVFMRQNFCDVLAVKGNKAYLVECKNYVLSRKALMDAEKELKRNEKFARELLEYKGVKPKKVVKVLVAPRFYAKTKDVLQFTPTEFLLHVD